MNPFGLLVAAGALVASTPTVPDDVVVGDVGNAALVAYDGTIVNEGDGTTRFFLVLPDDATCPGDSANDQWRVNSFLVPERDSVLDLWFGSSGPEPPWDGSRYPMFDNGNGLALAQVMLQRNEAAGQPGLVEQLHETSFQVHAENGIASGRYRLGIACSYFRQTTQYWDVLVEITAATSNDPSTLRWRVVEGAGTVVPEPPFDTALWMGRGLVAVGALIVLTLVRTRRRAAASTAIASRRVVPAHSKPPNPRPTTTKPAHKESLT